MSERAAPSTLAQMLAVARITFKIQITYRFDVIMNAVAVISRVLFAWILWGVVFTSRETVAGFTYPAMLSYYVVSSFLTSLDLSQEVGFEIAARVRGGTFTKFMVIPIHPQLHFLASTIGASVYYALFTLLAAAVSALMFSPFGLALPDIGAAVCALVMIPAGLTFMIAFYFIVGILSLKLQDVGAHMWGNIVSFCTGSMIPLTLLPGWAQDGLAWLPFPYVTYTPSMLLTGRLDAAQGMRGLIIIIIWMVPALLIGRFLYNHLRASHEGVGL
ncbi:ABC transporter permease [Clostridia bacterium]|nr:ABC transporter permease [Clostridia bacterium]